MLVTKDILQQQCVWECDVMGGRVGVSVCIPCYECG